MKEFMAEGHSKELTEAIAKEPHFEIEAINDEEQPIVRLAEKLHRLMLRMLKPFILIVLLFRVVDVVKLFDIIFATTSGGPMFTTTTIPILVYKEVFKSYTLGSAISKVLVRWVINYAISFWLAGRWRKTAASIR